MGTHLIFADSSNRKGKSDGDEFVNEAIALWKASVTLNIGDYTRETIEKSTHAKRFKRYEKESSNRNSIIGFIDGAYDLKSVSILCHGWQTGISLGFRSRRNGRTTVEVEQLAKAIAESCSGGNITVRLFCCLAGRSAYKWWKKKSIWSMQDRTKNVEDVQITNPTWRDGFAMHLCGELKKRGVDATIYAHLTSGHSTRNPYKVEIKSYADTDEAGNVYISRRRIVGKGPRWRRWIEFLSDGDDHRRFFTEQWPDANV